MILADNSLQDTNCDAGTIKMHGFKSQNQYDTISDIIKDHNNNQFGVKPTVREKLSDKTSESKDERTPIVINQVGASTNSFKIEINTACACRICLEEINLEDLVSYNKRNSANQLILPCLCKGTSGYCHQTCLKNWVSVNFTDYKFASCEICKIGFRFSHIKGEILKEDKIRIIKNLLVLLLFLLVLNILIYLVLYKAEFKTTVTTSTAILIFVCLNIIGLISIVVLMQKEFRFWRDGRIVDYRIISFEESYL